MSACPKCGNGGFDLEPGFHLDDPSPQVKCGTCGHVCASEEFMRPLREDERRDIKA